jgi:hypothetical protein
MTYLVALFIVITCAFGAAGASYLVSRVVDIDYRRQHHEVGSQVFQQLGIMFSVLLAFIFSEAWGEYNTAAQAINGECGALHGSAILANALPNNEGLPLNRAILQYGRVVVETEWPMMAHRQRSPEAAEDFRLLMDIAARLEATRPVDVAMHSEIISLLTQAHAYRETRTFQINNGLPMPLWVVLVTLALVLISFVLFAGVDASGHMLFASAFAFCTVLVLVLVRMLDYPFEGALAINDADFVKMLQEVSALARVY